MASRARLEAILELKSAILEAKMAQVKLSCRCWGEVGGMAERPWLRQEPSEYSWSISLSSRLSILSGCGGF